MIKSPPIRPRLSSELTRSAFLIAGSSYATMGVACGSSGALATGIVAVLIALTHGWISRRVTHALIDLALRMPARTSRAQLMSRWHHGED
jgi:hypothetical protein